MIDIATTGIGDRVSVSRPQQNGPTLRCSGTVADIDRQTRAVKIEFSTYDRDWFPVEDVERAE